MRIAIIGGGIAGLTATYELARLAREGTAVEAVLFESSNRLGGLIETVREGGFTVECGPDGWVSAKPWARELAVELGLESELISSNDATRKTWLYLDQRLVPMPDGMNMMVPATAEALAALEDSPLFSPAAVAAYRSEPARAAELIGSAPNHDESIADFTLRHFGPEVLARVAAPLLAGVFGGDVRTLSARAVLPAFVGMERTHGSLVAGLQAKQATENGGSPTAIFTTLRPGLGALVERLIAEIPPGWLRLNTRVTAMTPLTGGGAKWSVATTTLTKRRASETFDAVLLATPLDAARGLLAPIMPEATQLLPAESSSAVLVAFCFADAGRVPLPAGFGFLVPPSGAGSKDLLDPAAALLLACTFTDQKFPHRVPPGSRQVRAFFGGAAADRLARCNNDEIAAIARLELARILNSYNHAHAPLTGSTPTPLPAPVLTVIRRWPNSLPQYAVGHLERAAELESRLAKFPGLTLLGNSLHGVGLPDLIRDARKAARAAAHTNQK
jgi:oxygen-dependent protoporphyrinogen oxidase